MEECEHFSQEKQQSQKSFECKHCKKEHLQLLH